MKTTILMALALMVIMLSPITVFGESQTIVTPPPTTVTPPGPTPTPVTVDAPSDIISKADNYIVSLVGKDYFTKNLNYARSSDSGSVGKGGSRYWVSYTYNIPHEFYSGTNSVQVSLDANGNIVSYIGPKQAHTFEITKSNAEKIAYTNGVKSDSFSAEIRTGSGQGISQDYVWLVSATGQYESGATLSAVFLDVDTGKILKTEAIGTTIPTNPVVCPAIALPECKSGFEHKIVNGCPSTECTAKLVVCPAIALPYCEYGNKVVNGCPVAECNTAETGTIDAPTGPTVVGGTITNETVIHIIPGEGCTGDRCPISEARGAPILKGTLQTPSVSAEYEGELAISGSKLVMNTSAGQQQINIMPQDAVDISNVPQQSVKKVELKEKNQKPVYSVIGVRQAKLLFIMPVSVDVNTEVDAESGKILSVSKPWWSFLAW